jgi:hypothetical protein
VRGAFDGAFSQLIGVTVLVQRHRQATSHHGLDAEVVLNGSLEFGVHGLEAFALCHFVTAPSAPTRK